MDNILVSVILVVIIVAATVQMNDRTVDPSLIVNTLQATELAVLFRKFS